MLGGLYLVELDLYNYQLNLIYVRSLKFVSCLILGHFGPFFGGAHQFWASVAKAMGRWEEGQGQ